MRQLSVLLALTCGLACSALIAAPPLTQPVAGLRENTPAVYALTAAKIVVAPGREVADGVVVLRDGVITEVGAGIPVPSDARVVPLPGKTIYAGLVDAFHETSVASPDRSRGAPYWNELVTPQQDLAEHYSEDEAANRKLRGQGIAAQLVAPAAGIIKGSSAVVLTGGGPNHASILSAEIAQHVRLTVSRRRSDYPNSPMGAVALARQAFYDADWYRRAWAAHQNSANLPRPERNDALAALQPYQNAGRLVIIDAPNELYFLRADSFAREFGLNIVVRGSGQEYRRLNAIRKTGRAVLVPVDFPKPPNVGTAEAAANVTLETLMHWDLAPENPARLAKAGIRFALTTAGLDDRGTFLRQLRIAVARGLSPNDALRATTIAPAELLGVDHLLGTVEAGKLANLVVTDGELFGDGTKILETWVAGERFEIDAPPARDVRGTWQVAGAANPFTLAITGTPNRLKGNMTVGSSSKPSSLRQIAQRDDRLSALFDAQLFGLEGVGRLTAVIAAAAGDASSWTGHVVWPDGSRAAITGRRTAAAADTEEKEPAADSKEKHEPDVAKPASVAINYPLGAFGVETPPEAPAAVLFRNATIWTCDAAGVLENASLLIAGGRIAAIGRELEAPAEAVVVDLGGRHLTPGIIDCHSHMATDGGVNESGQAITAEVRIGDFINADDIAIYRQLAGGVTTSNILHGSANPIGGQNQVIKLRWGTLPDELRFAKAPAGIKFALGENVTQANRREPTNRYPRSRMGVEQIMRDAFHAARAYQRRWQDWRTTSRGLPPRRDLELDALAEILAGERWVHCHSYRQDEILALIRTLDDFDVQIGTFQHILEGYKVANEMAKHGAMGSAFSDWWAYKFEVYDAIPYAGALMHRAGVVVSFNSDDRELARHLNHEAAKAVKYGGVPPAEALKFVTMNPARQLRIDDYVGSLAAGKQADLVVWSGPPLSILSRCEQTWIDGRKYFDLAEDQQRRRLAAEQHNLLTQKILTSGQEPASEEDQAPSEEELWAQEDIFCRCRMFNFASP